MNSRTHQQTEQIPIRREQPTVAAPLRSERRPEQATQMLGNLRPEQATQMLRGKLRELADATPHDRTVVPDPPLEKQVQAIENAMDAIAELPTRRATDVPFNDRAQQLFHRRILIVDDEETNILTVQAYLEGQGYQEFVSTTDARHALPLIRRDRPDVVLLDIRMPHISGLEILRCLVADVETRHLPVIILTAASDPGIKKEALDLGAMDFLQKPVDPHDLIPRVRNALLIKSHMDYIAGENAKLDAIVRRRTEDLSRSRQQLILSLAKAAEHRDNDTGNHVLRVGRYAGIIARHLGWPEPRVKMIESAAQLHDVGKIGIPDAILFKPGRLDPDEWELMRKHCAFGKAIIEPVSEPDLQKLRSHTRIGADMLHVRSSPMMVMAARIAQTHHEWWDGSGYPIGLAGNDIPIEGRITAAADVFDALSSERTYKKAIPREKCFQIMLEGRGTQFDPQVLEAFFKGAKEIVEVQIALMDQQTR
ncbi:MAG: response regulator [Planctomycetales bacterium]|nr:response regulator [Planctomycetales bacterium]